MSGYIYCFSNSSMPSIVNVGMTESTPEAKLSEANDFNSWRPPTEYKIEFAKKVSNPGQKKMTLHILLEEYTNRVHGIKDFFRVSPEEVLKFFDLMDGEMWVDRNKEKTLRKREVLGSQASSTVVSDDEDTSELKTTVESVKRMMAKASKKHFANIGLSKENGLNEIYL